jgi:hypothetical protein
MIDKNLERIIGDEDLMCDFIYTLNMEIDSDDEPYDKRFRQLYASYVENPKVVDDVLMALCGWKMETLAEMTTKDY